MRNLSELVRSIFAPQLTIASRTERATDPADRSSETPAQGSPEKTPIRRPPQRTMTWLRDSRDAMQRAGRCPSEEEISRGAYMLARGVTKTQLEGLVRRSSSTHSLVVAFETLATLIARGIPVSTAVAKVGIRLETDASTEAIRSLDVAFVAEPRVPAGIGTGTATTAWQ